MYKNKILDKLRTIIIVCIVNNLCFKRLIIKIEEC